MSQATKENFSLYESNFIPFFKAMQPFLPTVTKTFLHLLAARPNNNLFFTTFAKLTDAKLISKELFIIKDIDGNFFFSDFCNELKKNYRVICQKKEYTPFYTSIVNDYKELFTSIFTHEEQVNVMRDVLGINFDFLSKKTFQKENIITIVNAVLPIFKKYPPLINDFLYLDNIKFNLLTFITKNKDYFNAMRLVDAFIKETDEEDKKKYCMWIVDNLFYVISNDGVNDYLFEILK